MTTRTGSVRWSVTTFATHRFIGGIALLVVGLVTGRADVAVLAVPLLVGVVWAAAGRPVAHPVVTLGPPRHRPGSGAVESHLDVTPSPGVDDLLVRVSSPGHLPVEVRLDVRTHRTPVLSMRTARTGRQDTFRVDHAGLGPDAVFVAVPSSLGSPPITLLPRADPLSAAPLPFRLQGVTGGHVTRRPGDGGDLRDVAAFAPGDRLRRIDWRATARRGMGGGHTDTLYVRRTFGTADAHVMVVLDPRDAVGPDGATWGTGRAHPDQATSLDLARHAAASLASHYLDQGDRVGLVDLGRNQRPLPPAAGRRHLQRLLHHLAVTEPSGPPGPQVRPPQLPSGVLVVVCSTFLDDVPADMARGWRHDGHRVVAVDVLPEPIPDTLPPHARTALRIVLLERHDRLADLATVGVEVVRWAEGGPPLADLEVAARRHRRPR